MLHHVHQCLLFGAGQLKQLAYLSSFAKNMPATTWNGADDSAESEPDNKVAGHKTKTVMQKTKTLCSAEGNWL